MALAGPEALVISRLINVSVHTFYIDFPFLAYTHCLPRRLMPWLYIPCVNVTCPCARESCPKLINPTTHWLSSRRLLRPAGLHWLRYYEIWCIILNYITIKHSGAACAACSLLPAWARGPPSAVLSLYSLWKMRFCCVRYIVVVG